MFFKVLRHKLLAYIVLPKSIIRKENWETAAFPFDANV